MISFLCCISVLHFPHLSWLRCLFIQCISAVITAQLAKDFKPFFLAEPSAAAAFLGHPFGLYPHRTVNFFFSLAQSPYASRQNVSCLAPLSICFIPNTFGPLLIANVRWFLLLHFLRFLPLPTNPPPSHALLCCPLASAGTFMHRRTHGRSIRDMPRIGR